jgi:hypothetical protein
VAAAHFKAEDGGVNHFEAKNGYGREVSKSMSLNLLDSDEGPVMTSRFSFSSSRPKK